MSANCAWVSPNFFLRKFEWGKGQTGGKIPAIIFVLTAFNFFGPFHIFLSRWAPSKQKQLRNPKHKSWNPMEKWIQIHFIVQQTCHQSCSSILEVVSFWGRMIAISARRQRVFRNSTQLARISHTKGTKLVAVSLV